VVGLAESRVYARVTQRLIPFLFCCYGAAYLDRVNIGFAKLQMLSALRFSETVYGLGAGIFFIGYFIFEIPSNIILHRVGARRWILSPPLHLVTPRSQEPGARCSRISSRLKLALDRGGA